MEKIVDLGFDQGFEHDVQVIEVFLNHFFIGQIWAAACGTFDFQHASLFDTEREVSLSTFHTTFMNAVKHGYHLRKERRRFSDYRG